MNRALAQTSLQDLRAALLVGQRDVDELIKSAGSLDGEVYDIRPVGGTDDEKKSRSKPGSV